MNALAAASVIVALVAVATAAGIVWRRTTGRVRSAGRSHDAEVVTPAEVGAPAFGSTVTLLQFSTEYCAPCRSTARILGGIADERPGVAHVDVDLTHRPDLAKRFGVLQTPTTLVLDPSGTIRARIGGVARADEVRSTIDTIAGSDHVSA
jgi:thiol-disulfide isomerase/thioredoxin